MRTRNYIVMTQQDGALDLLSLAEEASLGNVPNVPVPTTGRETEEWVDAETAGIPQRAAPPQPWAPRTPPEQPAPPAPTRDPGREAQPIGPGRIPIP